MLSIYHACLIRRRRRTASSFADGCPGFRTVVDHRDESTLLAPSTRHAPAGAGDDATDPFEDIPTAIDPTGR